MHWSLGAASTAVQGKPSLINPLCEELEPGWASQAYVHRGNWHSCWAYLPGAVGSDGQALAGCLLLHGMA